MTKRKSGRCACDMTISSVRCVRSIGVCWWCGDIGSDLMRFGWERLHVRCLRRRVDRRAFAALEMNQRRVRLCCVGPRVMKWLLYVTYDDGGKIAAATDF
jgi:hypothetical protein